VLALYPLIGLPLAIGVWIYARRTGDRALRIVAICLIIFFVIVLALRLAFPA
jgi:hypothetical protein